MEGASGAGANLSPSTMTPEDPSVASPSVRPVPGAVAWATDGMGCANASGNTAVTPGCDPSITAAATSTCIGGFMIGYVVPTTVSATSAVDSLVCLAVGNGIAALTGYSTMFEGNP